jgi:hypothetical protein
MASTASPPLSFARHLVLSEVIASTLIATYPNFGIRLLGIILIAYIALPGLLTTSGDLFNDYSMGSTITTNVVVAIALILLKNPLAEYRYVGDKTDPKDLPFWKKIYWSVCVRHNHRGIGWNYQVYIFV